jgi:hypothetical protein
LTIGKASANSRESYEYIKDYLLSALAESIPTSLYLPQREKMMHWWADYLDGLKETDEVFDKFDRFVKSYGKR